MQENDEDIRTLCKGCNKYKKNNNQCIIIIVAPVEEIKNCPCNKCILKVNCSQLCSDIIHHYFKGLKILKDWENG